MDQFIAGCRPNEANENGVFPCRPKYIKGKETWASERDVQIQLKDGRAIIMDDGGANSAVIDQLTRHLERNVVR